MPYPGPKVCAVCHRVLDYVEGEGYAHGEAEPDGRDHPAVPVDPSEVEIKGRCDFCFAEDPTWVLPVRAFQVNDLSASTEDWAACNDCAALIEKNQWSALARRVTANWQGRHEAGMNPETHVRRLHREIRKNITGSLRPL